MRLLSRDLSFRVATVGDRLPPQLAHPLLFAVSNLKGALGFGHFDARQSEQLLPRLYLVSQEDVPPHNLCCDARRNLVREVGVQLDFAGSSYLR